MAAIVREHDFPMCGDAVKRWYDASAERIDHRFLVEDRNNDAEKRTWLQDEDHLLEV